MSSRMGTTMGCVSLIGAGPGAADLLTIRALRALQSATVVLSDDLVSEAVLALASPTARRIDVGKRGGCRSTPQDFIQRLMVAEARAGERVARLKGGDPFLFGRGGEEVAYLQAHGIPHEVINGITAGLAGPSSLGAPLTHRDFAHGVLLVTGHARPGGAELPWSAWAETAHKTQLTLVIYMGLSQVEAVQAGLMQGLPAGTPALLIEQVSSPDQRQVLTTLGALTQAVQDHQLKSPCIMALGSAMALAHWPAEQVRAIQAQVLAQA